MIVFILFPFYSHSTDHSTPMLYTLLMILTPFYSHHSTPILLLILLMILLPSYLHSTDDSTSILLIVLPHLTDRSPPTLLSILLSFY